MSAGPPGDLNAELPPQPKAPRGAVLWPAGALVVVGGLLALLGALTSWGLSLLGALLTLWGVLGWIGEQWRAGPRRRSPDEHRRRVLAGLSLGLGGLAAGVAAVPILGVLVTPATRRRRPAWRTVGNLADLPTDSYRLVSFLAPEAQPGSGGVRREAAWLRRSADGQLQAWSVHCTHLGCPVRWEAGAGLFFCPCHGGVFDAQGRVVAGPPRIALRAVPVRVVNGQVQLDAQPVPLPTLTS